MDFLTEILIQMIRTSLISLGMVPVILLIRQLIRRRVAAKYCYYLWLILLIRLVFPFNISSPISIENYVEVPFRYFNEQNIEVPNNANEKEIITYSSLDKEIYQSPTTEDRIVEVLTYVWLFGVFAVAFIPIISYVTLSRAIMEEEMIRDKRLQSMLMDVQKKVSYPYHIRVKYNYYLDSPAVIGVNKPVILLPKELIDSEDEVLRDVLLHEVVHIEKKHLLLQWLFWIVKAIYWFNPIIWLAHEWMKLDAELMCDEEVVRIIGDEKAYGKVLIDLAEDTMNNPFTMNAAGLINKKSELKQRIIQLGYNRKKWRFLNGVTIALMSVIIPVFFTVAASDLPVKEYLFIEETINGESIEENYVVFSMEGYSYDSLKGELVVTMTYEIDEKFYKDYVRQNQQSIFFDFFLSFPKSFQPEIRKMNERGHIVEGISDFVELPRNGEIKYSFDLKDYNQDTYGSPVISFGGINVDIEFDPEEAQSTLLEMDGLPLTVRLDDVLSVTYLEVVIEGSRVKIVSQYESDYDEIINIHESVKVVDNNGNAIRSHSISGSYGEEVNEIEAQLTREVTTEDQIYIEVLGYYMLSDFNYLDRGVYEKTRWTFDIDYEKGIVIEEE